MHREFSKRQISRYCALNKYMFNLFITEANILKDILEDYPLIAKELKDEALDYTEFTA